MRDQLTLLCRVEGLTNLHTLFVSYKFPFPWVPFIVPTFLVLSLVKVLAQYFYQGRTGLRGKQFAALLYASAAVRTVLFEHDL